MIGKIAGLLAAAAIWTGAGTSAQASFFTAADGTRAASVDFTISEGNLVVTLVNTSTYDVRVPADVLTAVFFDISGAPLTLSPSSAVLGAGSTVFFGSAPAGGVVGGEWAYGQGRSGAPHGATYGISSSGFGLFGRSTFPGPDLDPPQAVAGLNYGIASAGDDSRTGNAEVTGKTPLIRNGVVFTLTGLPVNFDLSRIGNVSFQYGTALDQPNIEDIYLSEPTTMIAGALLLLPFGMSTIRFIRKNRKA